MVRVILVVLLLTSCTSMQIQKHVDGSYEASVTRLFSDVSASFETPDQGSFSYTSDAETASAAEFNRMLLELLITRQGL